MAGELTSMTEAQLRDFRTPGPWEAKRLDGYHWLIQSERGVIAKTAVPPGASEQEIEANALRLAAAGSAVETSEDDPTHAYAERYKWLRKNAAHLIVGYLVRPRENEGLADLSAERVDRMVDRELGHSLVETTCEFTLQDFGYAPGNYTFTCHDCGQPSIGDKRALRCEVCAAKRLEAIESPQKAAAHCTCGIGDDPHPPRAHTRDCALNGETDGA